MARLAALKAFVQWENRTGVIRGSQTRKGTLPADRGASVAAAPAASATTPPPASPVGPPVCGAVVPRPAVGVPSPTTVSPSHVCAAEVAGAAGETPPPKPPLAWWRGGLALVTPPRPNRGLGGNDPVGEFREPALAPHRLELLELSVGRTDSSGLLRRYRLSQASCDEEGGCLSFRDSTIPPLRSDTTFHSSLRAGCRVTISRSMRRSRARNTSRVTST